MAKLCALLVLLAWPAVAAAQEPVYYVNEVRFFEWDYDAAALEALTTFEAQIDDGPWVAVGVVLRWQVPYLVSGAHVGRVRACDVDGCSEALTLGFTVLSLIPVPPSPPVGAPPGALALTRPAGSKILTAVQRDNLAHRYAYLWRLRQLDTTEMAYVRSHYVGPVPATYAQWMNYLEAVFVGFEGLRQ